MPLAAQEARAARKIDERKFPMRYGMTITALASGVALLAATQLPAKAGSVFDLKSTTGMVQLVKSGGGGGGGAFGGGGSFSGGGGHMGGGGGGHMVGDAGGPGGRFAGVGSAGHMGHMSGDHFSSGTWGGSRSARIAKGGDFNGPSVRDGRIASNNWNGNWNGNWDHNHDHHFNNRFNNRFFFTSGPFFYGDYYAYNGYGNCAWLRRQAIITGSPYWWNRYQACLYY
jgi:hypothetical protein